MEIMDLTIKMEGALIKVSSFAARAHSGQMRKDGRTPYIVHPARVAARVALYQGSYQAQCAAWLHDVVEDCEAEVVVDMMELLRDLNISQGGAPVMFMIWALSKPHDGNRAEKEKAMIAQLLGGDQETVLVKLCDRIDNLHDFPTRCDEKVKKDQSFRALYLEETFNLLSGIEARAKSQPNSAKAWDELYHLARYLKGAEIPINTDESHSK